MKAHVDCRVCGKKVFVSVRKDRERWTCGSKECLSVVIGDRNRGKPSPKKGLVSPLPSKSCPECGKTFSYTPRKTREQRFCSAPCGNSNKRGKFSPPNKGTGKTVDRTCPTCGKQETLPQNPKPSKFCSKECLEGSDFRQRVWDSPESRSRASDSAKKRVTDEFRLWASERMKRMNTDPIIREKISNSLRGREFVSRGGNGEFTPQQLILHDLLGWPMEVPIPTGNPKWRSARVDLAHPTLKIAVECDGYSHNTSKQKNRDKKKAWMLQQMGWLLVRFWNSRIDKDTDAVISEILAQEKFASPQSSILKGKMLPKSTTLK